ncbi:hypothetical protein NHX12_033580 [Muraenolepis orangiensis]|uniref:Uncharacterized protein n=1 Tax=Muraenolepis orangiensis TaxID=630683 RepID=A0A9Q0E3Y9_9TELE|nr:hypothetical protein NHX12_033580 [Muraenolepis orangiensis]
MRTLVDRTRNLSFAQSGIPQHSSPPHPPPTLFPQGPCPRLPASPPPPGFKPATLHAAQKLRHPAGDGRGRAASQEVFMYIPAERRRTTAEGLIRPGQETPRRTAGSPPPGQVWPRPAPPPGTLELCLLRPKELPGPRGPERNAQVQTL